MENDHPSKEEHLTPEEYVEAIKASRLKLREAIKGFMEEETGETYKMEDDLSAIMKTFTQEQQQNIYGKIVLLQQYPTQNNNN